MRIATLLAAVAALALAAAPLATAASDRLGLGLLPALQPRCPPRGFDALPADQFNLASFISVSRCRHPCRPRLLRAARGSANTNRRPPAFPSLPAGPLVRCGAGAPGVPAPLPALLHGRSVRPAARLLAACWPLLAACCPLPAQRSAASTAPSLSPLAPARYVPLDPADPAKGLKIFNFARDGGVSGEAVGTNLDDSSRFEFVALPGSSPAKLKVGSAAAAVCQLPCWRWWGCPAPAWCLLTSLLPYPLLPPLSQVGFATEFGGRLRQLASGDYWVVAQGPGWAIITGGAPRTPTDDGCATGRRSPLLRRYQTNTVGLWFFTRTPSDAVATQASPPLLSGCDCPRPPTPHTSLANQPGQPCLPLLPPPPLLQAMYARAAELGLDTSRLAAVEHGGCVYPWSPVP